MESFVNWYTFLAFLLGVLLSATVKGLVSSFRSKASGSLGG